MNEVSSKTFRSGNSVAVRLPKELAVEAGTEVTIRKIGDTLEITPKAKRKKSMAELAARLLELGPPPGPSVGRERIVFPTRRGL